MRDDSAERTAFRNAAVVGWLLALQPILFVGAALLIRRLGARLPGIEPAVLRALLPVFYAVTAGCVAGSVLFRRNYLDPRKATPATAAARYVNGTIISLAFVEQPSVLGLVLFLLGAEPVHLIALAAVSLAAILAFLPRSAAFETYLEEAGRT